MSDFLTRLAQRSIGAAPLIAPRLPSLFAPAEEPNGNVADTAAAAAAGSAALVPATPQSQAAGRTAPALGESPADIHSPQRSAAAEAANASAPAARGDGTPHHVESTRVPPVSAAQENAQVAPPLPAPVVSRLAVPPETPATRGERDTPAAAPEPWAPLLPQYEAKAESTAPFSAVTVPLADAGARTAPTVHITIGRVEVRANIPASPPAPRPRAASQPTLSLGDYLKRGAGAS